jgi:CheY-like chemotaxis protein
LTRSDLVLFLVGPGFDPERLREPNDVVAFEWTQARFYGCGVQLVLVDEARMPRAVDLPAQLRWIGERSASALKTATLARDIDALVEAVPHLTARPRVSRVLWVDDQPANNEWERGVLRAEAILFDNVVSTGEAIERLQSDQYDLVITDLGREKSSDRSYGAGFDLLAHPLITDNGPPVIVYGGSNAVEQSEELGRRGARGVTADPLRLFELVRQELGRAVSRPEA